MEQLKYLLKKELSRDWIEKHLWLSKYNQKKIIKWENIKDPARLFFNTRVEEFVKWLEKAHYDDIL